MLISYAQNFEDVILWRALKHVDHGFYIDIGAQDPVGDSVSLAFYERGWRGVHVEPTPLNAARLRAARPDEDVVEAAISRERGNIPFFEIANTGMSTGNDAIAESNEKRGYETSAIQVETLPLSELLNRYSGRQVHWLKIDVEGMEDEVIASWQPSLVRPWILCIESMLPNTQIAHFASWEPTILELGYKFVYFDGLNRFYLHRDHAELHSLFGLGPNYFDDFSVGPLTPFARKLGQDIHCLSAEAELLHRHNADMAKAFAAERASLQETAATLEMLGQEKNERMAALEKQNQEKDVEIGRLHHHIADMERQLAAMRRSSSFRLTAPLRGIKRGARASTAWPRAKVRLGLEHALLWLRRRPRAAAAAKSLFRYSPWLEQRSLAFSRLRPPSASVVDWALEPDKDALNEWYKLLRMSRTS